MAFGVAAFIEIPGLIEKKHWRDLIAFSTLLLMGFILSLLYGLGALQLDIAAGITRLIKVILGKYEKLIPE